MYNNPRFGNRAVKVNTITVTGSATIESGELLSSINLVEVYHNTAITITIPKEIPKSKFIIIKDASNNASKYPITVEVTSGI